MQGSICPIKLEIETADGLVPVTAIGVALAYLRVGNSWECYEIPDVMVLEKCAFTLYSRASLRGRAGPALAGGFERRWAGSTDIFKVLSNLNPVRLQPFTAPLGQHVVPTMKTEHQPLALAP